MPAEHRREAGECSVNVAVSLCGSEQSSVGGDIRIIRVGVSVSRQVCLARSQICWPCLRLPGKSQSVEKLGCFVARRRGKIDFRRVCCRSTLISVYLAALLLWCQHALHCSGCRRRAPRGLTITANEHGVIPARARPWSSDHDERKGGWGRGRLFPDTKKPAPPQSLVLQHRLAPHIHKTRTHLYGLYFGYIHLFR